MMGPTGESRVTHRSESAMTATSLLRHSGLPAPLTPLVGREREVARVQAILLHRETRLLTLIGPGGTGKTRLALAVTERLADAFPAGFCFVSLAAIVDPDLLAGEIARALGLREAAEVSLPDRLADYLRPLHLLLLLDNVEQLLPAAAPPIASLLTVCPALKIVATSRMALHISGEREFAVPPLALPDLDRLPPPDDLLEIEAVRLFVERGQAVVSDFALGDDNAPVVATICRRLDGLPLAIELAAARLKTMPPGELLRRLERRLPLLTGGPLDLPARQRTLRDAIAWSYDLLTVEERAGFRRLAVFVGGFMLDAAEAVCGDDALDLVASLVDKSLLRHVNGPGGAARYAMLETVREYALDRLNADGEADESQRRHAAWFLDCAERLWAALARGPIRASWLDWAESDHDNLRAALTWFDAKGETEGLLRMTAAVWPFWMLHGHLAEWTHWVERGLPLVGDTSQHIAAIFLQGAAFCASDTTSAVGGFRRAELQLRGLALFEELGDRWGIAASLAGLGFDALYDGDYGEAGERYRAALAVFEERGDRDWVALTIQQLGEVAFGQGDLELARLYFEQSLALHRALADPWGTAQALNSLGLLAVADDEPDAAIGHLAAALPLWREVGSADGLIHWLARVAALAVLLGQAETGARLLGAYLAIAERLVIRLRDPKRTANEAVLRDARDRLGEQVLATALDLGRSLALDDAIRTAEEVLALARLRQSGPATPGLPAGLSPREREVLCLLAGGRTYPQIAGTLFLSPATIRTHVQHIYAKLGVQSRHEAAAYAREHGLC
jgi:predicted ATPase/DNA-binding CsgD family transcriptional regulator